MREVDEKQEISLLWPKLVKTNFDAWAPTCHTLRT